MAEETVIRTNFLYFHLNLIDWFFFITGMIRTMLSFSIIHILMMIITFNFGLYSIRDYRYTYKRLTGMIFILTGKSSFDFISD